MAEYSVRLLLPSTFGAHLAAPCSSGAQDEKMWQRHLMLVSLCGNTFSSSFWSLVTQRLRRMLVHTFCNNWWQLRHLFRLPRTNRVLTFKMGMPCEPSGVCHARVGRCIGGDKDPVLVTSSAGILVDFFLLFGALGSAAPVPTDDEVPSAGALSAAPWSSAKKTFLDVDAALDEARDGGFTLAKNCASISSSSKYSGVSSPWSRAPAAAAPSCPSSSVAGSISLKAVTMAGSGTRMELMAWGSRHNSSEWLCGSTPQVSESRFTGTDDKPLRIAAQAPAWSILVGKYCWDKWAAGRRTTALSVKLVLDGRGSLTADRPLRTTAGGL